MIQEIITYKCRECGSSNITRNGTNRCGSAQYHCKDCGVYRVLKPKRKYTPEDKETILRAYRERASLRGLERIFKVARQSVARWLKELVQQLPDLKATVEPAQADDIIELDELWSFVGHKGEQRWLWLALCRRTRQIVAFVIGDRSKKTCQRLYNKLPDDYKTCNSVSDLWEAYQLVFPSETHCSLGKEWGATNHIERWNNTIRQRLARFVRKTLSFSKSDVYHQIVTKWFFVYCNLSLSPLTS